MRGMEGPKWAAGGGRGMSGWGGPAGGGRLRMRRGDIRRAILVALKDGPAHGYEVMRRLEERSGGIWRPSPGSVYPTLQALEDEGVVRAQAGEGTRTYELTDAGRAEAEADVGEGGAPWEAPAEGVARMWNLRTSLHQLHMAARQVGSVGNEEQVERALEILQQARKDIYRILADG